MDTDMPDNNSKPVVLLIYSNTGPALDWLKPETDAIEAHLSAPGLCDVKILPAATLSDVVTAINDPAIQDRVAIVHFAGHANGQGIQLQSTSTSAQGEIAYMRGLADVLKMQPHLRLLFINGCASREQVLELTQAGIPLVIATKRGIDDKVARDFAECFYRTLGQHRSIAEAFQVAAGMLKSAKGKDVRGLYFGDHQKSAAATSGELPWELHGPDADRHWSLREPYYRGTGPRWDHTKFAFNPESPYLGLRYFAEEDSARFFGRDEFVQTLLTASESALLLLVIGASGTGKSSVVRAGMIPHWKKKHPGLSRERAFVFTPQDDPFEQLATELARIDNFDRQQIRSIRDTTSRTALRDAVMTFGQGEPWLLFIDQFEQVFTRTTDKKKRADFLDAIVDLAKSEHPSVCLVLAMRDDFFPQLREFPELFPLTDKHCFRVAALNRAALQEVIERPAAEHGVTFQPGLVDNIIEAVDRQPGALPLLQYTLDALWKADDLSDHLLNGTTYRDLGGVTGSLGRRLQALYDQHKSEQDQFRWMMLKLVTYDDSATGSGVVSRLAPKAEFEGKQADLLDELIGQSLVVSSGTSTPAVQLGHEKIIEAWPEFTKWTHECREANTVRQQLSNAASEWTQLRARSERRKMTWVLWQGSQLVRALELRTRRDFDQLGGLALIEHQFLDASQSRSHRLIRLLLWATGTAITAVVLTAWFGIDAEMARKELSTANIDLKKQTRIAESRECAALARAEISTSLESALLLGLKALQDHPTFEAKAFLFDELTKYPKRRNLIQPCKEHVTTSVRCTPNHVVVAEVDYSLSDGYGASRICVRDRLGHKVVIATPHFPRKIIREIAVSPSGGRLAALYGGSKQGILLMSLENDELSLLETIEPPAKPTNADLASLHDVVFSPDGNTITSAWSVLNGNQYKSRAIMWDMRSETPVLSESGVVDGLAFSVAIQKESGVLAIGYQTQSETGRVAFWDIKKSEFMTESIEIEEGGVSCVRFSNDGQTLAASYGGSKGCGVALVTQLSNTTRKTIPIPKTGGTEESANIYDLAFSHNGNIVAAAHNAGNGGVAFIDVKAQDLLASDKQCSLYERNGTAGEVSFSFDSDSVAYSFFRKGEKGELTGGVATWRLDDKYELADHVVDIPGSAGKMCLTDRSSKLTVAYDAMKSEVKPAWEQMEEVGIARVDFLIGSAVDVRPSLHLGQTPLMRMLSPFAYELSPDGRHIALRRKTNRIDVCTLDEANVIIQVSAGEKASMRCCCFSPDGKVLAVGYLCEGPFESPVCEVLIWDIQRRTQIRSPIRITSGLINCLRFSDDGNILVIGLFLGDVEFVAYDLSLSRTVASPPLQSASDGYTVRTQTTCLAFSPDGHILAQGVKETVWSHVVLWNARTWTRLGKPLTFAEDASPLKAEFHPVNAEDMLAVLTQRTALVREPLGHETVSEVHLYAAVSGKPLGRSLVSTTEPLGDILFSPDGKRLAATAANRVLMWEMDWTALVQRIVGRNLTWAEWERLRGSETPYRRIFSELPAGDGVEEAVRSGVARLSPSD
jgi:WD40 repeat protein